MSIYKIYNVFKNHPDNVLIIGHRNADLDSVISSIVLREFLKKILKIKKITLFFPGGISERTREILSKLKLKAKYIDNIDKTEEFDIAYFLDTGGFEVIGDIGLKILDNDKIIKILVDHHQPVSDFIDKFNIKLTNPDSSSTLELILDIISRYCSIAKFKPNLLKAILVTIYVETRFLSLASRDALFWFTRIKDLVEIGIEDIRKLLFHEIPLSEKIAVLKAFKRMEVYRARNYLMVITNVSAYMNQVSSQLSRLGVDIAIVYTSKKKQCKVHIRLSDLILNETGVNLYDDLLNEMSRETRHISYGGHLGLLNIEYKDKECDEFLEKFKLKLFRVFEKKYQLHFKKLVS